MLPTSTAVLLVAAPSLHRQGLMATLQETWPGLALQAVPDASCLPTLLRQSPYALLLADRPQLPALPRLMLDIRPQPPALLLTETTPTPDLRRLTLGLRRCALLSRQAAPAEVVAAIRMLLAGPTGTPASAWAPVPAASQLPPTPFSPRELEVLRLVVDDFCNQEIADQLCLSVRTVESHRRALLQKAGARSVLGLAVQAVRAGWVAN